MEQDRRGKRSQENRIIDMVPLLCSEWIHDLEIKGDRRMSTTVIPLAGINKDKESLYVKFFDLPEVEEHVRSHKSYCPSCKEGMLLMHRGTDGQLIAQDMCALCAQRVVYVDIELVRRSRP